MLYDLLLELKELETKEICVNNKTFKLKLRAFICDAPARQMIKCIRSHNIVIMHKQSKWHEAQPSASDEASALLLLSNLGRKHILMARSEAEGPIFY